MFRYWTPTLTPSALSNGRCAYSKRIIERLRIAKCALTYLARKQFEMTKQIEAKEKTFVSACKNHIAPRPTPVRTRWSVQQNLDLRFAASIFEDVEGGIRSAMIDRLQMAVLRSHQPLEISVLSNAVRVLGNCRHDRFHTVARACDLQYFLSLFCSTMTAPEIKGIRSRCKFHFCATFEALEDFEKSATTDRKDCRLVFVDLTPMRFERYSLLPDDGKTPESRRSGKLIRFTMLRASTKMHHAIFRAKVTPSTDVVTEALAFEAAKAITRDVFPQGLFVSEPQSEPREHRTIVATTKAIDAVEAVAQFIVNSLAAYRTGSKIALALSDATGLVDPTALKKAIDRHPLKVQIAVGYLPTGR